MLQKLKGALDNSVLWLIFLFSCVLYFWKKEKDLESELEQEKANETIKYDKQAVAQADSEASDASADYERIKHAYLDKHGLGDGHGNND